MRRFTYILLCLFIAYSVDGANIEIRSRRFTTRDGLSNNTTRFIYQDSKGFLWFSTLNGLDRYDGNSFVNYYPKANKQISLVDNRVHNTEEDQNGCLWIATTPEQFSCFDLRAGRFVDFTGCGENLQNYKKKLFVSNGDVWLWHASNGFRRVINHGGKFSSIVYKQEKHNVSSDKSNFVIESRGGDIWLGTQQGLTLVHKGKPFIVNKDANYQAGISYTDRTFFITSDGTIQQWNPVVSRLRNVGKILEERGVTVSTQFAIGNKWYIFTLKGGYVFDFNTYHSSFSSNLNLQNVNMLKDNRGDYWLFNKTGKLYWVKHSNGSVKTFQLIPSNKVGFIDYERYHVVHDSRDIIWISTYGNGLFVYKPQTDQLEHFTADFGKLNLFGSNFLNYVAEDRSGEIWVSSEYTGLSCITVANGGSDRLFVESNHQNDRSNAIRLIHRMKNGDIWLSTRSGGLYVYDSLLKECKKKYTYPSNVYALEEDYRGIVWIGTRGSGLRIGEHWYRNDSKDKNSLANDNIFSIYRDRSNRMWVGTFGNGLDLAEKVNNKYIFRHFFNNTYSQRQIRAISEDSNGFVWMGTSDGLYIFQPGRLIRNPKDYIHFSISTGHLKSNDVKCIKRDSQGRMWVGMSGAGFCIFQINQALDYRHMAMEQYNASNGLVDNMVQAMEEDTKGNMWISTEYGISRMNYRLKSFVNYFLTSDQIGNVYSENASSKGFGSELWFGTNYGLVRIHPESMRLEQTASVVQMTHLKVNGVDVFPDDPDSPLKYSLIYMKELNLKYDQNSIVIDFSTFDYSDNNTILYSYKLENYEDDWSLPSSLNFAAYKNLSPGKYRLLVKACNANGVWNHTPTSLIICVHSPFWLTTWAFLVYAVLLVVVLFFTYRIVRNFARLRNRITVEKQLMDYKLVFFTNISHEFRTPLTLIEGALEKMQEIKNLPTSLAQPLKNMDKSAKRMMRLVNQLLEFRKMQNNKLSLALQEIDIISFLNEICDNFKEIAEAKNMTFSSLYSVESYNMFVDKGHLDKIMYNLLSNAFKYTPSGGKVDFIVKVDEENHVLSMKVVDTGVGIPKNKRSELFSRFMQSDFSGSSMGVGLHLTHELVLTHKGTIQYSENEGSGSIFTVTLPLDKSVYNEKDFLIPNNAILQEENQEENISKKIQNISKFAIGNPLNKQTVLVIEDDLDVRAMLKESLSPYFNVETEPDGTLGLKHAMEQEIELIVCDVLMPGLTGYEVTTKLKSDINTSHIPIILLTALGTTENHIEGIASGADAYIVKPFSMKLLLARIFNLLEQRDKLRKKFSSEPGILTSAICTTDRDKEFVNRLHIILEKNMENSEFSIDEFAAQMRMGRTAFYKKVRGITGYSPNEYIRILRMKKAAELLIKGDQTVSEVSYKVGLNDPFYFSKCFKAQFGVSPSTYMKGDGVKASSTKGNIT